MCGARRVLVVEDNPALRSFVVSALTDEGYTVSAASDGADGLAKLHDVDPCVVLLDLRMPVLDGWGFARAFHRRQDAHAHILVMTAEKSMDNVAEIAPADVVQKPFDLDALLTLIERWVSRHVPRSANKQR